MTVSLLAAGDGLCQALAGFDARLLSGSDAARVAEQLAMVEKRCAAARVLAAVRAVEAGAHQERGFKDGHRWVAQQHGSSPGQALRDMETARSLEELTDTKAALVAGEISLAQAAEIVQTEAEAPGAEQTLLAVARAGDLPQVKDRARQHRQAHTPAEDLHRQQRAARHFRHWRDRLGMVCFQGALPPETGLPLVRRIEVAAQRLRTAARRSGQPDESFQAHAGDALCQLVELTPAPAGATPVPAAGATPVPAGDTAAPTSASTATPVPAEGATPVPAGVTPVPAGDTAAPTSASTATPVPAEGATPVPAGDTAAPPIPASASSAAPSSPNPASTVRRRRAPATELVIVVDLYAWRRGIAIPGEVCHIIGGGPIPVELAKELSADAFLKVALHDGVDIQSICHFGRRYPAHLSTALDLGPVPDFQGQVCAECGRRWGLQRDHINPVANQGLTQLANLQPLCWICHQAKTERDRQAGLLGPQAKARPKSRPRARPPNPP